MTADWQRTIARALAAAVALVALGCVLVLTADYAGARRSASRDADRIAALQMESQADASASVRLAAEHDRVTRARRDRKARTDALAVVLLAASALFIAGAKWLGAMRGGRPLAPLVLVRPPAGPPRSCHVVVAPMPAGPPAAPAIDLSFVDVIVGREGSGPEAAIPILQAIQAHYRYLPDEALARVCAQTAITPSQIAGTSSFYARFRRSPLGDHLVRVCHGTACHVSGARQISQELRRTLDIPDGADTDARGRFTIDEVACLGCCSLAPVMMVNEHTVGRLTPAAACGALDRAAKADVA